MKDHYSISKTNKYVKKRHLLYMLMALVLISLIISACETDLPQAFKAESGRMDLTHWQVDETETIKLDGEWELYQNQLLTPTDFVDKTDLIETEYFPVPSLYKETLMGDPLPKYGYATLRLNVDMPESDLEQQYGLIFRQVLSASKIWVNGNLLSSAGTVSKKPELGQGSFERQVLMFPNDGSSMEIVVQMSNYDNVRGKVRNVILGKQEMIKREYIMGAASDMFIAGALFIMGIYHLALYAKRRQNKTPMYFAFFCLAIGLRNLLVGGRVIYEVLPTLPFALENKLAYLTVYAGFPFLMMFFVSLFPNTLHKRFKVIINSVSVIIILVTLFTQVTTYNTFLKAYELLMGVYFAYVLFLIARGIKRGDEGARIILFGVVVFLAAAINDMLLQEGLLNTRSLASYGFFVFIFSQSYLLASQFSNAFIRNERLVEENKAIYFDHLTGITNRRGFFDQGEAHLQYAKENNQPFIIIYGDLNQFKQINDTYGHKEGDEAIKKAASLLKSSLRKEDIVARMSGDEFIAIAVNQSSNDEVNAIIDRINENFKLFNMNSNKPYTLSISLGYSVYNRVNNKTLDELVYEADVMLYSEKLKYKEIYV